MGNFIAIRLRAAALAAGSARRDRASWPAAAVTAASVAVCGSMMVLGAHVRIPVPGTDVPMTLQLLAVLLTGFALSPARAAAAVALYVTCGTLGLPVFVPGSGGLLGPTGGYLVGFIVAAWLLSAATRGGSAGMVRLAAAGTVAVVVVFAFGVGWRVWLFGDVGLAVSTGVLPFALKAVVELALALAIAARAKRWRRNSGTGNTAVFHEFHDYLSRRL